MYVYFSKEARIWSADTTSVYSYNKNHVILQEMNNITDYKLLMPRGQWPVKQILLRKKNSVVFLTNESIAYFKKPRRVGMIHTLFHTDIKSASKRNTAKFEDAASAKNFETSSRNCIRKYENLKP